MADKEIAVKPNDLNLKQEEFSRLYATDKEFFGNGVESYIEAYDPDTSKPNWYKSACSSASRLLRNVKVIERINGLLEETGFTETAIDKQLSFLITQHADFSTKLGAIREYNKLKGRISDRTEVNITLPQPILSGESRKVIEQEDTDEAT